MKITADSTRIDDAVIDGLRPQARRYDVAVSDELVLAVLPNGSKTWTWVYDGPGQPHRQTLGIYPEMSLEQARQALKSAARTRRGRGAPAAYVIRDGRIEPSGPAIEWKWPLAGALALAAGGIVLGWWLLGGNEPAPDDAIAAREPPTETLTLDKRLDAGRARTAASDEPLVAGPSTDSVPAAGRASLDSRGETQPDSAPLLPISDQTDPPPASAAMPARQAVAQPEPPTPGVTVAQQAADTPADAVPIATQPGSTPAVTIAQEAVATPAGAVRVVTRPEPTPAVTVAQESAEAPADTMPAATPPTAAAALRPDTAAGDAPDPVVGARITAGTDFEPGVEDDRVARAQITSAVVDREPVDTLGPVVTGNGEAIQTFAFFTELRSLAGQRVRHRWIAGDRIQAEIPFDVGEAWRWRIFSSKRLLASMAGPWRVQVVTDDDTVIYDYAFEFRP